VHVAAVLDGGIDENQIRLFVNGVEGNLYYRVFGSKPDPISDNLPRTARVGDGFKGYMDDVRLWGVARTQDQLRDDMARPINGSEPGLLGYWRLDESYGSVAVDSATGDGVADPLSPSSGDAADFPDRVLSTAPILGTPSAEPPTIQRIVYANEPLDPFGISSSVASLTDSTGRILDFVRDVQAYYGDEPGVFDRALLVTFDPLGVAGNYRLSISPGIRDVAGNVLDQDRDGNPGEPVEDDFHTIFTVTSDVVAPRVTRLPDTALNELTTMRVEFSEPIDPATFTASQVSLVTPSEVISGAGISVRPVDGESYPGGVTLFRAFELTFPRQTVPGEYTLVLGSGGPLIADFSGNRLDHDGNGIGGQAGDVVIQPIVLRRVTQVSGAISAATTWSGTVHVTGDVRVDANATLTVLPNTVVKFARGTRLEVDGQLNAVGLASQPIIFTSVRDDSVGGDISGAGVATPERGDWENILLDANSSGSIVQFAEIRYAGNSCGPRINCFVPALQLDKDGVTLMDVTLREVESTGVFINRFSPALSRVTVNGAGGNGFFANLAATPTLVALAATRVGGASYGLQAGTFSDTRTWDFGGLPVHLTGDTRIGSGGTLSIVPGQVVKLPTTD
jgi:hypothetical protein